MLREKVAFALGCLCLHQACLGFLWPTPKKLRVKKRDPAILDPYLLYLPRKRSPWRPFASPSSPVWDPWDRPLPNVATTICWRGILPPLPAPRSAGLVGWSAGRSRGLEGSWEGRGLSIWSVPQGISWPSQHFDTKQFQSHLWLIFCSLAIVSRYTVDEGFCHWPICVF
jgi:hypothetical protein